MQQIGDRLQRFGGSDTDPDPQFASEPEPDSTTSVTGPGPTSRSAYDEPISNRAEEEYWKLMSNMPRRKQPGKWRRLGSALASMKPGQTQERLDDLRYPGFRQEMADWKIMQDALETPMLQERIENQGIRTARRYETANQTTLSRIAMQDRHNQAMEEARRRSASGFKIVTDENGEVYSVGVDGVKKLGITQMSELEKIQTRAEAITNATLQRLMLMNQNELEQIAAKGEIQKAVAAIPTSSTVTTITPTPPTPENQVPVERFNRAQKLLSEYEGLSEFIQIDPKTRDVVIVPAGTKSKLGIVLTPELRDYIYEHIFNNKPLPPRVTNTFRTTSRSARPVSPVMPGAGATQPNQPNDDPLGIRR